MNIIAKTALFLYSILVVAVFASLISACTHKLKAEREIQATTANILNTPNLK
jgi:hypothetical protein